MKRRIIKENMTELVADNGYIHKIGTETYFKKGVVYDSVDNYEEVDEMPKYTEAEYNAKVAELIHERYDTDKETALINNMLVEHPTQNHREEYAEYQAYRAECKDRAKDPELYSAR